MRITNSEPYCSVNFDGSEYQAKVICYNHWDFGLYDLGKATILRIIFDGIVTTVTSFILNDSEIENLKRLGYDYILRMVREAQYKGDHFGERNLGDRFQCGY